MISPSASLGRSSFTQVITSPGFNEGRGMAAKEFRPGEGVATTAAVAAGVRETPGSGVAAGAAGVAGT